MVGAHLKEGGDEPRAAAGSVITPSITTSEPGVISAATSGKAAEDGSAGTTTGAGRSSGWPFSAMRRPVALRRHLRPRRRNRRSIRSVWSRVASLSITVVRPAR